MARIARREAGRPALVSPWSKRIALVIPTLNEEEAIGAVLARLPARRRRRGHRRRRRQHRQDASSARARPARKRRSRPGAAMAAPAGRRARGGDDCAIVVFMDGDGADSPELIPRLVGPIVTGTPISSSARALRGTREPGSMSAHQIVAGLALGRAMRLSTACATPTCALFARSAADALMALGMREMTYGWNIEMQMRAARARACASSNCRSITACAKAASRKSPAACAAHCAPARASSRPSSECGGKRERLGQKARLARPD